MAETTKSKTTKKSTAKKATKAKAPIDNTAEAKSRFNAALDEARAGAVALKAEAGVRAGVYREQAREKGTDLVSEAKNYSGEVKAKAGDLAVEGKARASDALSSLGKIVADTATQIDEKVGEQYGDYARKASRSLQEASAKLESKSVEEIGEDAREMVRKSPGTAIGIAAVLGFLVARLFRGGRG
jgi:ElaB/YqjD/DUF883 family membrane-anchored ribosome-binding protein